MTLARPLRFALGLWLALGIALTIRTIHRPDRHTSFPLFASGSDHWWIDAPLYADYPPLDEFRYPPTTALAITPFAVFGLTVGGILWSWVSLAVYGAGLWQFARRVLPVRWSDTRLAIYLCLALFAGLRGLWNAQSNALIVGLLLLGAAALARQRWWRCVLFLTAATAFKPTTAAILMLLVALWPMRLAPRLGFALLLLFALPFATRPPTIVATQYQNWIGYVRATGNQRWPSFRDGWTVWSLSRHHAMGEHGIPPLKKPIDSPFYRIVQLLAAIPVLLWCLRLRWRGLETRSLLTRVLAAGLAWTMLFGPAVEYATYVFLAPVLCWALLEETSSRARRGLAWTAGAMILLLGWGSLVEPFFNTLPLLLIALPMGCVLFVGWLVWSTPTPTSPFSDASQKRQVATLLRSVANQNVVPGS